MSVASAINIGKVIYNILRYDNDVRVAFNNPGANNALGTSGGDTYIASAIQPAPLKDLKSLPAFASKPRGIVYEVNSISPLNIKREFRTQTAPIYVVGFSLDVFHYVYRLCNELSTASINALEKSVNNTYNGIKISGIKFDNSRENFNEKKEFCVKEIDLTARILI